jgi:acetate---CoA ligase (ADP-forming)
LAIVGASDREGGANWSKVLYENLRATGTGLPIYPVNPRYAAMWGQRCFPSLDKLPQPVDLALVIVSGVHVPEILQRGVEAGVRASIVYSGGFDHQLTAEVEALCANGLRVSGPNSHGTLSVHERLLLYPSDPVSRVRALPAGDLGAVFQNGRTAQYWLQQAAARGLGFSYVVTSGAELDLDVADYLNFLVEDERTRLICCVAEDIRRPDAFVEVARKALAAEKPVLVLRTGPLAPSRDALFDAVCDRYGVVRCVSLDDLIETAVALRFGRVPRSRGVVLVTDADASVPDILADPSVGIVAIPGQLPTLPDERQRADAFRAIAAATEKPVVAYSYTSHNVGDPAREFQRAAGMPFLQGIAQTERVLHALVRYGMRRSAPPPTQEPLPVADEGGADYAAVLGRYDIASPQYRYASSSEEAVQAAREIGYPVALKAIAPQIVHKAEAGAVRLGLDDAVVVQRAAIELANNLHAKGIAPVQLLVQEMVEGPEMVVGARDDDEFGPFIVLGFGGTLVELLGDVALRLLPVSAQDVREMLEELRCAPLLKAFRGRPTRDVDALVAAVTGVSRFYLERRHWIRDFEINPLTLLAWGDGVRAVDARVTKRKV